MQRLLVVLLLVTFSCAESTLDPDPERVGFDYFPLAIGDFQEFEVLEVEYDVLGNVDSLEYQLRTEVVDTFSSAEDLIYIIHRFQRTDNAEPWTFQRAWSAYRNSTQGVLIEENQPFIKLSFPIEHEKLWNGNALNGLDANNYLLSTLSQTYTLPDESILSDVLEVEHSNQEDLIGKDLRIEQYAKNIGLVYKLEEIYTYCQEESCLGLQEIESGSYYKQELIAYGQN